MNDETINYLIEEVENELFRGDVDEDGALITPDGRIVNADVIIREFLYQLVVGGWEVVRNEEY